MSGSATHLLKKAPASIRYANPVIICRRPQCSNNETAAQPGVRSYVELSKKSARRPVAAPPRQSVQNAKRVRLSIALHSLRAKLTHD